MGNIISTGRCSFMLLSPHHGYRDSQVGGHPSVLAGCSSEVASPILGASGEGRGTAGSRAARLCPALLPAGDPRRPHASDPPPAYKQGGGVPQDVISTIPSDSENNNRGGRWKL